LQENRFSIRQAIGSEAGSISRKTFFTTPGMSLFCQWVCAIPGACLKAATNRRALNAPLYGDSVSCRFCLMSA